VSEVRLEPIAEPAVPLEAPCVRPDAFAALAEAEIARLPVLHGNELAQLGDFFRVRGGRAAAVRVLGGAARVKRLGEGMTGGVLVVEGDAGAHAGAGMAGGTLRIEGNADLWAGAEMRGGLLEIRGDAGARLAAAYPGSPRGMTGGVVLVHGSAGELVAERMRRGLVAIGGRAGAGAGAGMLAGTLVACGGLGRHAGAGLRRGTLVSGAEVELLPTYRYACTDRPLFLELYLRHLRDRLGFRAADRLAAGTFRRYNGDFADLGRGELLVWTTPSPHPRSD